MGAFQYMRLLAIAAVIGEANSAEAAPALPRVHSMSWTGTGCGGNNAAASAEPGKLIISMPAFVEDEAHGSTTCNGHFGFADGLPGRRLAIKSVFNEGYLFSSGNVTVTTVTTIWYTSKIEESYTADSTSTFAGEGPMLQKYQVSTPIPVEWASACIDSKGQGFDLLNINFRMEILGNSENTRAVFMGMEADPVKEIVSFEWVPCDAPAVEIET